MWRKGTSQSSKADQSHGTSRQPEAQGMTRCWRRAVDDDQCQDGGGGQPEGRDPEEEIQESRQVGPDRPDPIAHGSVGRVEPTRIMRVVTEERQEDDESESRPQPQRGFTSGR